MINAEIEPPSNKLLYIVIFNVTNISSKCVISFEVSKLKSGVFEKHKKNRGTKWSHVLYRNCKKII